MVQAAGRVAIHDNILVDAGTGQSAISVADHNGPLKVAYIYNNTVYGGTNGIRFGSAARVDHLVAGNAVFADQPIGGAVTNVRDNVVDQISNAGDYVAAPSNILGAMNFYPLTGRLQGTPLAYPTQFSNQRDFWKDFNGSDKGQGAFRGAYAGSGVNPGWQLDQELKPPANSSSSPPNPPVSLNVR